jgi:hypothetical protein
MRFPPTLVINLVDRPEKMEQTRQSFTHWPVELERLDAVRASPGWKGCTVSHFKAITVAKQRNYDWVLILEDDAQLTESGLQTFTRLLPILYARRSEWDIFLGGSTMLENIRCVSQSPPLFEAGAYTTHFCLIHRDAYDKILQMYDDGPIDVYYKEKMRLWMTNPHIAIQRPGVSDIENGQTDYGTLFTDASRKLWLCAFFHSVFVKLFLVILGLILVVFMLPKLQTYIHRGFRSILN